MIEVEKDLWCNRIAYYIKGTQILHREDGPAFISMSGTKEWWINGKRHREDGPAIIYSSGTILWLLNDIHFIKKEDWLEALPEDKRLKALYSDYFIGG
jgi:hypothetical protein